MAYVYILKSLKDNKKYTGSTPNLKKRFDQHNKGYVQSTRSRRPFILYAYQQLETIEEAAILENKYKRNHDLVKRMIKLGKLKLADTGM